MSRVPIRLRVAGAFVLVMALVLLAAGLFVDARVRSERMRAVDADLRAQALRAQDGAIAERDDDEEIVQRLDADARVLDSSEEAGGVALLEPADVARLLAERDEDDDVPELRRERDVRLASRDEAAAGEEGDGEPLRLLARPSDAGEVVVAAASLEDVEDELAALRTTLLLAGLAALALTAAAAYGAVAAALRPVELMRARAAAISDADPAARLPVPPAQDEIGRLGRTLNEMLARLQGALLRERRFVADASHELRTPLSVLQAELELAARPGRTADELRAAVASAGEETDRLARLAADLLVLARADGGRLPVRPEPIEAGTLLERLRERFAARADAAGRPLRVVASRGPAPDAERAGAAPGGLVLHADPLRVEQALGNLLDNALVHGAGEIVLSAGRGADGSARLAVRDAGAGLPAGFAATAFEPFTRADRARGRADGGSAGLGLAIVAAVAEAHGGRAGAEGAEVWIELPPASASGRDA